MINTKFFFDCLIENNVKFYSGVPDSLLKNICAYISDNIKNDNHVIAANEGNAVGLGIGYYLSTGKLPMVYMQNSGFGNVINPLMSLADSEVYSIPMILLIGWRGEPNVNDEPQHKKQGKVTLGLLDTLGIPYKVIGPETSDKEVPELIRSSCMDTLNNNSPFAIVVKKNCFSNYKSEENFKNSFPLTREEAIKIILKKVDKNDIIVSTTGVASRELYEIREQRREGHEKDFLTVGGMGHANQIAIGIAMQKPMRKIFCIDGDGSALMHLGTIPINGNIKCQNFVHIIINNGAHDSVGGQPTVGYQISFENIANACGYDLIMSASTDKDIEECLEKIKKYNGKVFLEIKTNKGFRDNLGRPSTTPKENKNKFMKFISYGKSNG